jgi:molybdopterin converting factor small subunit
MLVEEAQRPHRRPEQPGQIREAIHLNQVLSHPTLTFRFVMALLKDITIHVPRELRGYCRGASEINLSAPSVRAALDELEQRHPSLYRGICDDTGAVRRHVNVFVNKDHMRDRDGLETALVPGDEIFILPAVSGG